MGREKKLLLGFLGLLAGAFVGVLAAKLFVPRPPAGTGPDIRPEVAVTTPQERVEPPSPAAARTAIGWDFSAAPPLVPDTSASPPEAVASGDAPDRFSKFAAAAPLDPPTGPTSTTDGQITPASWQQTDPPGSAPAGVTELSAPRFAPPATDRFADAAVDPPAGPPVRDPFAMPPTTLTTAPRAAPPAPVAGDYLVQAGDSWWDVAERAYGDGRFYRALYAWNRVRDPRIALSPGTRLDVPPLVRLEAAWPRLLPPADAP